MSVVGQCDVGSLVVRGRGRFAPKARWVPPEMGGIRLPGRHRLRALEGAGILEPRRG